MIHIDTNSPALRTSVSLGEAFLSRRIEAGSAAEALKSEAAALRHRCDGFVRNLDTVDPEAARRVQEARDALFTAWSKLRAAETLLDPMRFARVA